MSNKLTYTLLALIIILAGFLRFYKLDTIPASLNWDEVAAGYNAYTIANWGMDEYGNKFPITFKSFADDKHPVHIYLTSLVVKIFGLSDYTIRSTSAGIGVLTVIALFFLAKELFSTRVALLSSLFLAVSPYHIHFSRGLWENNFALFFLIAGLALFYKNIPLSLVSFGLSFFSYHSAKVIVPPIVFLLFILNFKKIITDKKILLYSLIVVTFFSILTLKDLRILGFARINQTKLSSEVNIFDNYKKHFTYNYLFQNGDQGPRASVKVIGQFYKIDLFLLIIGFVALIYKKKWQALSIILLWLLLSPIPSSVSSTDPSAIRGIFTIGPVLLLSASGTGALISLFKNKWLKAFTIIIILTFLSREVINYLNYYFKIYPVKEAIEWQYGMKEIVEYTKENPKFYKMYVDNIRQQPYIYFLYYQQVSLPKFLSTVKYDQSNSKSFNTVLSFDKYQFGSWNIIDSYPNEGVLYVITPSYYGGLRHLQQFDLAKLIRYPDGSDAFYIVEGHAE